MSTDCPESFSAEEARALASVLDEIIPPSSDGRMPGAGAVGLVRHIEQTVQQSPELGPVIAEGLAAVDALARQRAAEGFAQLPKAQKLEVLREIESSMPAFLSSLIFPTYVGYYQHPLVYVALGLGADPPHPHGYGMEPNDLTLLDPVRRLGKRYRDG
jgi:hypothetical protein